MSGSRPLNTAQINTNIDDRNFLESIYALASHIDGFKASAASHLRTLRGLLSDLLQNSYTSDEDEKRIDAMESSIATFKKSTSDYTQSMQTQLELIQSEHTRLTTSYASIQNFCTGTQKRTLPTSDNAAARLLKSINAMKAHFVKFKAYNSTPLANTETASDVYEIGIFNSEHLPFIGDRIMYLSSVYNQFLEKFAHLQKPNTHSQLHALPALQTHTDTSTSSRQIATFTNQAGSFFNPEAPNSANSQHRRAHLPMVPMQSCKPTYCVQPPSRGTLPQPENLTESIHALELEIKQLQASVGNSTFAQSKQKYEAELAVLLDKYTSNSSTSSTSTHDAVAESDITQRINDLSATIDAYEMQLIDMEKNTNAAIITKQVALNTLLLQLKSAPTTTSKRSAPPASSNNNNDDDDVDGDNNTAKRFHSQQRYQSNG